MANCKIGIFGFGTLKKLCDEYMRALSESVAEDAESFKAASYIRIGPCGKKESKERLITVGDLGFFLEREITEEDFLVVSKGINFVINKETCTLFEAINLGIYSCGGRAYLKITATKEG